MERVSVHLDLFRRLQQNKHTVYVLLIKTYKYENIKCCVKVSSDCGHVCRNINILVHGSCNLFIHEFIKSAY